MARDQRPAPLRDEIIAPASPVRYPRIRPRSRDLLDELRAVAGGGDEVGTVLAGGLSSVPCHDTAPRLDQRPGGGGTSRA